MRPIEINTKSAKETKKVGFNLVAALGKKPTLNKALIITLEGNLGSGKTTFIQGLAKGFGVRENVLSPTFVILKEFPLSSGNFQNFYHVDAYRLKNPEELLELGFKDVIKNPKNLIVIEWADKIKKILPRGIIKIKFENLGKNKRKIIINKQ
ncbi:MAG: P-loop hydrolase [Parcubacteria group bacterium GW2011_GWC1_43_11]|uniref:tRNA threonylcarbamoyladenosine biosynthesis protein TsaE n=1 Tax=Candidatus Azambacteria bacterium GW2011_GWA1_42_19 TaxID=1618609 RepID=A0A0G1BFP4_9BACT|nr:MAG: hypothetical protein UV10_C0032G0002 [Candidatus Azambacteria bacterium GW2011_GWA1_42_19]KKS88548.1 MAG: P-loop hydrolase [Parcubacteria group bacterium GW2011_GWC1_43_11]